MATKSKKAAAERQEAAVAVQAAADVVGVEGVTQFAQGANTLENAKDAAYVSRGILASGASNVTRGIDALAASERAAQLSEITEVAGLADISQGDEMLSASDNLVAMGAVIQGMSEDDLDLSMEMAAIAGQMATIGEVIFRMGMPRIADFMAVKSDRLQELAADTIMRFAALSSLAEAVVDAGEDVGDLGFDEVGEGFTRLAISDEMAYRSDALAEAGVDLTLRGIGELEEARELRAAVEDMVGEAADEMTEGGIKMGAAETMADVAETLAE